MDPTDTSTDDAPTTPSPGLDPGEIEARLMVADRLAEFRVNVLASLGLDASDLRTLRSVLDGQLVCEREAAEPTPTVRSASPARSEVLGKAHARDGHPGPLG